MQKSWWYEIVKDLFVNLATAMILELLKSIV